LVDGRPKTSLNPGPVGKKGPSFPVAIKKEIRKNMDPKSGKGTKPQGI